MKNIRVASVQFEHVPSDKEANLAKIENFVRQAAGQNVELIVFPEACITGYLFLRKLSRNELEALAEPVFDGPSSQALMALARRHKMTIGAGLVEIADDGKMYNTYVVAMPNGEFQRHRKIHCFISEHLSCGSEFTVFDSPHDCRLAVLTCYDNNLGENVRIAALKGAEILLAPHQTGGCKTPSPCCMGVIEKSLWQNRKTNPQAIEAELRVALCADRKPKPWVEDLVSGDVRDLIIGLLTAMASTLSVPLAIAVPATAIVMKRGIAALCSGAPRPVPPRTAKQILDSHESAVKPRCGRRRSVKRSKGSA